MTNFFCAVDRIVASMLDLALYVLPRSMVHVLAKGLGAFLYTTLCYWRWQYEAIAIQKALDVSFLGARKIALYGYLNTLVFLVDYHYFAIRSAAAVSALSQNVRVEGIGYLMNAMSSGRPVIVTSIHMDSFLLGLLKLCECVPSHRPITVIKFNAERKKESQAYAKFAKMGLSLSILRLRDKPGVAALQTLRAGNLLFVLCDVDPSFVKTARVPFLGESADFPCGPLALAIASKALVVPMVVFQERGVDRETHVVRISSPIDSQAYVGSFADKTVPMTACLAKTVEGWIRQFPEQWQMWAVVPNMWKGKSS